MMVVQMVSKKILLRMILIMMVSGNKFVIKQETGVRKQFLILNSEIILVFVTNGEKFVNCTSYTEVTESVDCKVLDFGEFKTAGVTNILLAGCTRAY